jgi:hypothetical protein
MNLSHIHKILIYQIIDNLFIIIQFEFTIVNQIFIERWILLFLSFKRHSINSSIIEFTLFAELLKAFNLVFLTILNKISQGLFVVDH